MAFERFKTLESLWSLWNLAWEQVVKLGIYGALAAMLTAAGAVLYSAGKWINQFGAAGWILSIVAAIITGALLIGIVAWAIDRVRIIRSERARGEAGAEPKLRGLPLSQRLDNIDFTLFHLTTRVVADLHGQIVHRAFARIPIKQHDINLASATNDALNSETESLNSFVRSVGSDFVNTRWWHDLAGELRLIEYKADQELRSVQIPPALNLLDYRLNHIARLQRDRVAKFLQWVLDEEQVAQGQALNMMYQRKELHKRS
ncbi:MAG: hypothetical protein QOH32_1489 [Bradyrhizobium sp.]|jgi:hypothetical protein|nr:hypothetical protein [Bradyrhizobium sp.]